MKSLASQLIDIAQQLEVQKTAADANRYVAVTSLFNVIGAGTYNDCEAAIKRLHSDAWLETDHSGNKTIVAVVTPISRKPLNTYYIFKGGL